MISTKDGYLADREETITIVTGAKYSFSIKLYIVKVPTCNFEA